MITKHVLDQMLKQATETNNRLSKHIENLWEEIGEKQTTLYELKGEIYDLKDQNKHLSNKIKEFLDKFDEVDEVDKAQFQKNFLDHYNPRKTDN